MLVEFRRGENNRLQYLKNGRGLYHIVSNNPKQAHLSALGDAERCRILEIKED